MQQPVPTIDCDVYDQSDIVLTCRVVSSPADSDITDVQDISIKWYFYNGTEYELSVGVSHIRSGGNGANVQVTSTFQLSAMISQGFYYCRVQLTEMNIKSNLSQRFEVLSQDDYIQLATCSGRTFIDSVETCAVYQVEESPKYFLNTTTSWTQSEEAISSPLEDASLSIRPGHPPTMSDHNESITVNVTWVYVLAAVAAVFATIIIILTTLSVSHCLRQLPQPRTDSGKWTIVSWPSY